MHKCWLVAELVSMIFTHMGKAALDDSDEAQADSISGAKQTRSTLLNLALSCKTLKEIALDLLWRDIDSLVPLVDCLPMIVARPDNGTILMNRPVGPEDFIVFQKYARRVHSIRYSVRDHCKHEPHLLRLLSNFPCELGNGLLPNLKHITWKADDDESISFLRNLVPRTLVSLRFIGSSWPLCKCSLVSFLGNHFPNLKEFHCVDPPRDILQRISEFVCNNEELSSLATGPLTENALKYLMRSTALRKFAVSLPDYDGWDKAGGTFLPTLTYFLIRGFLPSRVVEYLANLRLSPKEVCIRFVYPPVGTTIVQSLKHLVEPFDNAKLSKFTYVIENTAKARPSLELPANAFDALFRFKSLTCLLLENFFTPYLNDEEVINMAKCWPCLQELKIGTGQDWTTDSGTLIRSRMTLYGVAYVAQHCQQLRVLGLVFDATAPLTAPVPEDWMNPRVDLLNFGGSMCSMENVGLVASLIAQLFPKFSSVHVWDDQSRWPPPGSRSQAWNVVISISKRFIEVQDAARRKAMKEAREELRKELENMGRCSCALGGQSGNSEGES